MKTLITVSLTEEEVELAICEYINKRNPVQEVGVDDEFDWIPPGRPGLDASDPRVSITVYWNPPEPGQAPRMESGTRSRMSDARNRQIEENK
jgi:hypothetical protein